MPLRLSTLARLRGLRNRLPERDRAPDRLMADMGLAEPPAAERRRPGSPCWPILPGAILRT